MAPELQRLLTGAALAIPFAILITLIAVLMNRRKQRRRNDRRIADAPAIHGVASKLGPLQPSSTGEAGPHDAPADASVSEPGVVRRSIAAAEANGEKLTLAPLYLKLALAEYAAGNQTGQLTALRSAAGLGALHGPPSAHAEARIALAEISAEAGDLTSACEQWQIARNAYNDDGNTELTARVDKRMRENGCPTDWVLTDF